MKYYLYIATLYKYLLFSGQLPAHYLENHPMASAVLHEHFNDKNLEDVTRYRNVSECDFLVDSMIPSQSPLEPLYGNNLNRWTPLIIKEILVPESSSQLCRAFFIPFMSRRCTKYSTLVMLQSNKK